MNGEVNSKCPLCDSEPVGLCQDLDRSLNRFTCARCGTFETVLPMYCRFDWSTIHDRHLLSGLAREHWERHGTPLRMPDSIDGIADLKRLTPRDTDVREKAARLLLGLARKSHFPGEMFSCNGNDFALAYSRNHSEFHYLIGSLSERNLIGSFVAHSSGWNGVVSPAGWVAVDAYAVPNSESDKVFVAMWFDPQMDSAYSEGIVPAVEQDCGYRAVRIDLKEFLDDVVDEIIAEIRESRFIVADFTGHRSGVYYEAGYARGFGLPVIWTCKKDHISDLHFDTRQQNHIAWDTPQDLRKRLTNRIRAVIGAGPHRPSNV